MRIYPAIDILNKRAVRLYKGDFNKVTSFGNPLDIAKKFEKDGASFLHIVDLDGAKNGYSVNLSIIKEIVKKTKLEVQVGGGIRSISVVKEYLDIGVKRVILGSKVIEDESFLVSCLKLFGEDKIVVGVDVLFDYVMINGWAENSNVKLYDFIKKLEIIGVKTIIYTDISKDGVMNGFNNTEVEKLIKSTNINIIVSGGISNLADVDKVRSLGCEGVVIGKAIYLNETLLGEIISKYPANLLCKRIIPCLDVKGGRVVKGVHFVNLIDVFDPVSAGKIYSDSLADELVFLDIMASVNNIDPMIDLVEKVSREVFIPLTFGGGIKSLEDINRILRAGADKVSLNTFALTNPSFVEKAAFIYGKQCITVAIDAKFNGEFYEVYIKGGREKTGVDAVKHAINMEKLGAGEILLTSIDNDGTKSGYELNLTNLITNSVNIPVIASGGAGKIEDFINVFKKTKASAALAASLFHFGELSIIDLKKRLRTEGIKVRL